MKKNTTGRCPDDARGKRVTVVLRNGYTFEGHATDVYRGTKLDWSLSGGQFDVIKYEVKG